MKPWHCPPPVRRYPRLELDQQYGVPPNTPTEFMAQFFASLERKGLLRVDEGEGVDEDAFTLPARSVGDSRVPDFTSVTGDNLTDIESNRHLGSLDYHTECREEVLEHLTRPWEKEQVDERKLKPKPPSPPDPHELLLKEIRSRPKLRSIRQGKLLVEKPKVGLSDELEAPPPTKRVIKADLSLLMNNCSEDSSEDEDCTSNHSLGSPQSLAPTMMAPMSWQRAVTKEVLINGTSGSRPTRLQRRHTIMVCDSSMDGKVQSQELPPLTEEEEPSPVRENPLSHQFSPLGVAGGATLLHRTSFSEHDLSNQITLRNPHLRARTVLEHRRSLTSIPTGLTSIPEMDDVFGGMDSPPKPGAIRRSWSHEQAPPPNPSPPCKGRARSAMIMSGTKTVGRNVTQPSAFKRHVSSSPKSASMSEITSMYTTNTSKPQTISSSLHASNRPQSQAPSTKHVSNKSSRMQKTLQNPLLDMDVSIQSPGYFKSPFSVSTPSLETLSSEGKTQRDSPSRTLSERSSGYTSRPNTDSPKRKIIVNKEELQRQSLTTTFGIEAEDVFCDQDVSSDKPIHNVQIASTNDILISRRPSLDGGMSLYSGATPGSTLRNRPNTRNSLTEKREGRLKPFKSPEEEERLTRWRMLQEEELAHRQKKTPGEINLSSLPPKGRPDPEKTPRRPVTQDRHRYVDGTDVLQQKLQSEEARFARWRHLEETGISALKKENLLKASTDEPSSSPVHNLKTPALQTPTPDLNKSFLSTPLPKHWQNPVECLSLTLEEVTHIREVLTKAELESLISHPDLYQQVSKSKICFTCKTTKFSLFGEWGSKCKLCKRTVCSKCLRKMNIPTDHFKNIPVYTLSPAPLPTETHEFIQKFIKSAPPISVPPTQDSSPVRKCIIPDSHSDLEDEAPDSKNLSVKPVQRSHSVNITSGIKSTPRNILKGPLMAVCCDCKGMVMEIIRASRASLAMLSASSGSPATSMTHSPAPQSLLPNSPEMRKMVKK
ncbi:uncharacterized protein LOC106052037 isoform X3 [Biomphalaria glabrata]|uniref:Uncharacterized protein LOC106052037 isoform X3 n=1 Tax=Biomphalaria glabrata TaxID=6526 RepID=A0A9W3AT30_BIOGL|nr:uncharacterized protein LOC106052037 isoform X3 [Biomphalaria glabrata]